MQDVLGMKKNPENLSSNSNEMLRERSEELK
jgi:hypothetical protein